MMRCHTIGEIEHDFIGIAPSPPFRRIVAFDYGVARRMKMFAGVTVGGTIAATDMAAGTAEPEMEPP